MEEAAANRAYDELHKAQPFHDGTFKNWADKWSRETPFHYRDGVLISVSQRDTGDDFLGGEDASPGNGSDDDERR